MTAWAHCQRQVAFFIAFQDNFDSTKSGSIVISQLALALKPRYHICGLGGIYYERQPYR